MGRETRNLASHSLRSGGEGPNPLSTSLLFTRGWAQAEPEKKGRTSLPSRSRSLTHSPSLPPDAVGVGAYRIFLNQEDKRGPSERQRKNKRGEREGERESPLHPASVTRMHMCCALRRYTGRLRRRAGVARRRAVAVGLRGRATSFDFWRGTRSPHRNARYATFGWHPPPHVHRALPPPLSPPTEIATKSCAAPKA